MNILSVILPLRSHSVIIKRIKTMTKSAKKFTLGALLCVISAAVVISPLNGAVSGDVSNFDKIIQNSLNTHCTDCHDEDSQKGDLRLDNWSSLQEAEKASKLESVLEQVFSGIMPPKNKNALNAEQRKTLFDAIDARHRAMKSTSEFAEKLSDKMKTTGHGNYVDHEQLFSGEHKHLNGFTYDRDWLISEFIFSDKVKELINENGQQRIDGKDYRVIGSRLGPTIVNPFLLPKISGVRYFATEKINSSHFLTMMGNSGHIARTMIGHLSRKNPNYLPSVTAMTKLDIEHDEILAARKEYIEQWIDVLCAEVHGDQNESMLPTYTKIELQGDISETAKSYAKNGWKGHRIGVNGPFLVQAAMRFARKGKDKLEIIRECERFYFHMGYDKEMVARLVNNLRTELASIIQHKAEVLSLPERAKLSSAELSEIKATIKAQRAKGMTYLELIDRCMAHWRSQFREIREKSVATSEGLPEKMISELYAKLFRRSPTQEELKEKMDLLRSYSAKIGVHRAVTQLTETLLLKSEFITRGEYGVGSPDEFGRRMMSPRDASYAIAYALTDSSPDDLLVKAAHDGRLNTREDYRREVDRILKDRSRYYIIDNDLNDVQGVESITNLPIRKLRFFREFFGYYNALDVFKDQSRFGAALAGARERLIAEADMLVERVLAEDKNVFETLLTTDKFYVYHSGNNDSMLSFAEKAKNAYDYFKKSNWMKFMEPSDMLAHKEFLLSNGLPGFDNEYLRKAEENKGANKRAPPKPEPVEEDSDDKEKKVGRRAKSRGPKLPPDPAEIAFGNFINALVELEKKYQGNQKYIVPPGAQLRSPSKANSVLRGGNVVDFYGIQENKWDYPPVQPAKIDHRMGILTHPAWLQAFSQNDHTDVVLRGKWIREKLLAGTVADVPITVEAVVPADHTRTYRDRLDAATSETKCSKCHQYMNPLGFAFEMYDDFGRYRTEEELEHPDNEIGRKDISQRKEDVTLIHPKQKVGGRVGHTIPPRIIYKTKPVNTTGEIIGSGERSLDGEVKNAFDMISRMSKSTRVRQSIIRHAFRYFLGRNEMLSDSKTLIDAEQAYLQNGGSFDAVIVSLLTSDAFIYRKENKE